MKTIINNISILFILLLPMVITAQPNWTFTNTGTYHTVLSQGSIPVTINGTQITTGDYIGAFYNLNTGGLACAGYVQWTGNQISIFAYGTQIGQNNGFETGEEIKWKIWQSSGNIEYIAEATYDGSLPQQQYFLTGGFSALLSLTSFTPINIISSISNVDCFGNNNGSIDITVISGAPPFSFIWSNSITTEDLTNVLAGEYFLTISDSQAQIYSDSFIITEPQELIINYTKSEVSLQGESDGSIDISVSGGNNPYIYFWSSYTISEDIIGLDQGFYTVTVTDANMCQSIELVEIGELAQYQILDLTQGWTMFSTYIDASEPLLDSIFQPILPDVLIVKNGEGYVFWPSYSLNLIGSVEPGLGYQIKMIQTGSLSIIGNKINPSQVEIVVPQGWSMIGYLNSSPGNPEEVLTSIYNNIVIMKDHNGFVFWPQFNFNLIGDMMPGLGYQINLLNQDTLIFPADQSIINFLCGESIVDFDENYYNTVLIGSQCWMAENLRSIHYSDGTPLIDATNMTISTGDDSTRYFFNYTNPLFTSLYGTRYSWIGATNNALGSNMIPSGIQGVCPEGWHIPGDEEWKILEGETDDVFNYPDPEWDNTYYRGSNAGLKLRSTYGWDLNNNGTDDYGFAVLPGGFRDYYPGAQGEGHFGDFWTSTVVNSSSSLFRGFYYQQGGVLRQDKIKSNGLSIRCVKDILPELLYDFLPDTISFCNLGGFNLDAGQGYYSYLWNTGESSEQKIVTTSGEYSVCVTDSFGNQGYDTVFVSLINDQIFQEDTTILQGDTIQISIDNTSIGTYYLWSNGDTSPSISVSPFQPITYYVTISDGIGSCVDSITLTIGAPPFYCGTSTMHDYDGNSYDTEQIGNQCWMKQNLRVTHFPDGTSIPYVTSDSDWSNLSLTDPAYCYPSNNISMAFPYGGLYTWSAVMNGGIANNNIPSGVQGICPDDWHVPSDEEWKILEGEADSQYDYPDSIWNTSVWRGFDAGHNLKAGYDWDWLVGSNGSNLTGFTALPAGTRNSSGAFPNTGYVTSFWSCTESLPTSARIRTLSGSHSDISRYSEFNLNKFGHSVRCVKDTLVNTNLYPTVSTNSVINILQTSIECYGDVISDGGSSVTDRGICWNTTGSPTISDSITIEGTGIGTFISNITNLQPNTTYYVKAYATNIIGTAYGYQITFTTLALAIPCPGTQTVTDYDGNTYNTVLIGNQCWMKENIRVTHYSDGTAIPNIVNNVDWQNLGITNPGYCAYNNNPAYILTGLLYNWPAIVNGTTGSDLVPSGIQGICPTGWHIPSDEEWKILEGEADSQYSYPDSIWDMIGHRGIDVGFNLKATSGWYTSYGSGLYGFSSMAGGVRHINGDFGSMLHAALYWTSSNISSNEATYRELTDTSILVNRNNNNKLYGLNVRCVMD